MFFTYLARCSDESLYVGSCKDIKYREIKHNEGGGAKYTKDRRPIKIIYFEEFPTREKAVKREFQIKKWTKIKKENLIKYGHPTKF